MNLGKRTAHPARARLTDPPPADPTLRRRRWLPPRPTRDGAHRVRHAVVHALSSPTALAMTVFVAAAGLLLAFYVALAQINLTNCLADYNNAAAQSTRARAEAAAEDRALDLAARDIDSSDRRLDRQDAAMIDAALAALGSDAETDTFASLRRLRAATAAARDANDLARSELASKRRGIELRRAANPPPAPPSERCG